MLREEREKSNLFLAGRAGGGASEKSFCPNKAPGIFFVEIYADRDIEK
jgi:hypothetical protein